MLRSSAASVIRLTRYNYSRMAATAGRLIVVMLAALVLGLVPSVHADGVQTRVIPRAWLNMPRRADGAIPKRLSQTGAFADTRLLIPASGLIPYELIESFWSDGADKQRWIAIPAKIGFAPTGEWSFPAGTVFVKTFELPHDEAHPQLKQRLETRLLVRDADGGVYGVVYKWRSDGSDADLINTSLTEQVGSLTWYYPSRVDCLQ